jgi:hypothetical protein
MLALYTIMRGGSTPASTSRTTDRSTYEPGLGFRHAGAAGHEES